MTTPTVAFAINQNLVTYEDNDTLLFNIQGIAPVCDNDPEDITVPSSIPDIGTNQQPSYTFAVYSSREVGIANLYTYLTTHIPGTDAAEKVTDDFTEPDYIANAMLYYYNGYNENPDEEIATDAHHNEVLNNLQSEILNATSWQTVLDTPALLTLIERAIIDGEGGNNVGTFTFYPGDQLDSGAAFGENPAGQPATPGYNTFSFSDRDVYVSDDADGFTEIDLGGELSISDSIRFTGYATVGGYNTNLSQLLYTEDNSGTNETFDSDFGSVAFTLGYEDSDTFYHLGEGTTIYAA